MAALERPRWLLNKAVMLRKATNAKILDKLLLIDSLNPRGCVSEVFVDVAVEATSPKERVVAVVGHNLLGNAVSEHERSSNRC